MKKFMQLGLMFAVVGFMGYYNQTADAQIVPYKAFGTQAAYSPVTGNYSGNGNGTHVGLHTFVGNVVSAPAGPPGLFNWATTVPQTLTAADGSRLFMTASGQVQVIPLGGPYFYAIWQGHFNVVGGTGRFASAGPGTGPIAVIAVNDPFTFADPIWTFSWKLVGDIKLK